MSDETLRDRIADTVESAGLQWDTDFNAWMLGRPNSADPGPQPPRIAQAIIDEFGLTVEAVGGNKSISSADWRVVESPVKTRIVGKWVKQ